MLFTVELLACPIALQLTYVLRAQISANMLIFSHYTWMLGRREYRRWPDREEISSAKFFQVSKGDSFVFTQKLAADL